MRVRCSVNRKRVEVECGPCERLLDLLRRLGCTSVKEGCGEGECGACSVFVNGRLVNACLLLAPQAEGAQILTLEGLQEETKAIRERFESEGAVQCGFCTPALVLRAYDYVRSGGRPDPESIRAALDGNVCRCTGYNRIVKAVRKSLL